MTASSADKSRGSPEEDAMRDMQCVSALWHADSKAEENEATSKQWPQIVSLASSGQLRAGEGHE